MIPSGCAPPVLVTFADSDASEYDAATGCLKEPNEIVTLHNSLLRDAVEKLRAKHPDVAIIHTDLFNHVTEMVQSPEKFGFKRDVLTVCCGGPGRYHYNLSVVCGDEAATTCEDPSTRLFWDGVHLTEAAYHYIAEDWLNNILYQSKSVGFLLFAHTDEDLLRFLMPFIEPVHVNKYAGKRAGIDAYSCLHKGVQVQCTGQHGHTGEGAKLNRKAKASCYTSQLVRVVRAAPR
ncbi:GDSL esterase/lipase [Panicum miliaceum]|uniref:GDSL esterase/lipase n=1 Tax=Panicum miliaceum TaxID=4540 RepID=A0A3L6RDT7_PANMI|nr:GDSL esterase/lipase [Panicum miliaceum]